MDQLTADSHILIEPILNKKPHGFAMHGKKFNYGLMIKNIGDTPSVEFMIGDITLESAQGQNIIGTETKQFYTSRLNPREEKHFDVGEHSSFMHGLVRISAKISPIEKERRVACFQRSPSTNTHLFVKTNDWVDFFYIKSPQEIAQEIANSRIRFLTFSILLLTLVYLIISIYLNR